MGSDLPPVPREVVAEVVRYLGWAVEKAWHRDSSMVALNMNAAMSILRDHGFDVKGARP